MGLTSHIRPSPRRSFRPSEQQAAFLDRLQSGDGHIVLEARAGTGKSTTCREGAWSLGDRGSIYCCFNKHIQREFQPGLPRTCEAATLHSLGFRIVRDNVKATQTDKDKVDRIADDYFPSKNQIPQRSSLKRLVSLCKNTLNDGRDVDDLESLAACYDIRLAPWYKDDVLAVVADVLEECRSNTETIDFDDQVWLPVVNGWLPAYVPDVLFVDEAQDLNAVQHALVDLLCPTGRMVVVGDEYQSIYAFRGADSRSMPKLHDRLATSDRGVVAMPLNVTRRCPQAVVELARRLVSDIQPMPNAPLGDVASVNPEDWTAATSIGDMVLCRTNAPLVSACYQLWTSGVRAQIIGRDLGKGLSDLLDHLRADDVGDVIRKVGDYRAREIRKFERLRNPATAIQHLNDRCDCLIAMCKDLHAIGDVRTRIAQMFAEVADAEMVTLSSIHKAKGLERDHVVILRPDLLPGPWAKDGDAIQQEYNLLYVAITRSKSRLTIAGDMPQAVA